jgi:hypothetical protein
MSELSDITMENAAVPPVAEVVARMVKARIEKPLPEALLSGCKDRLLKEMTVGREAPPKKSDDPTSHVVVMTVTYYEEEPNPIVDTIGPAAGDRPILLIGKKAVTVEVNSFSLYQVRKLCQHVGISAVSSDTKYACRRKLASFASLHQVLENSTVLETGTNLQMKLYMILRFINALFHPTCFNMMLTFNDKKDRVDHETGNTQHQFFQSVADIFNCSTMDVFMDSVLNESKLSVCDELNYLAHDAVYHSNLRIFSPIDKKKAKKWWKALWAMRKSMMEDMDRSGTHESDPWLFIDASAKKVANGKSLTKYGMYYFWMRVENHPDIENQFSPSMLGHLKGDSNDVDGLVSKSKKRKATSKEQASATMAALLSIQEKRMKMEERNDDRRMLLELLKLPDTSPGVRANCKKQLYDVCNVGGASGASVTSSVTGERGDGKARRCSTTTMSTNTTTSTPASAAGLYSSSEEDSD